MTLASPTARRLLRPGFASRLKCYATRQLGLLRAFGAAEYRPPTALELSDIEAAMLAAGFEVHDYRPDPGDFSAFRGRFRFPQSYLDTFPPSVQDEKLLEHYLAFDLLGLADFSPSDSYVDIAACGSPWADILRRDSGLDAFAIDLAVPESFATLPHYIAMDATRSHFGDASLRGASLQCAFEMFEGDADVRLIRELARVLAPGGRCIIAPLYMHTRYCGYSTPEHYLQGHADPGSIQCVRRDCWGVPFSRKYDVSALRSRILATADSSGLQSRIRVLRNASSLGSDIYCHFILELSRRGN